MTEPFGFLKKSENRRRRTRRTEIVIYGKDVLDYCDIKNTQDNPNRS
jgi:hypothetical protein